MVRLYTRFRFRLYTRFRFLLYTRLGRLYTRLALCLGLQSSRVLCACRMLDAWHV